jgi:putative colanic acid biosynthesis acetyltransferase WcaF
MDTIANRASRSWTLKELLARVLWRLASPLFIWSPRPLWWWRRALLRGFGAKIGAHVQIYPTVRIAIPWNLSVGPYSAVGDRAILYALGPITIGHRATISQGAHLCAGTHDYRDPVMPLLKLPIEVGDDAWICADAFVGPNVHIGSRAIVGARAVVMRDVPNDTVVAGNPARIINKRNHR